MKRYLHFYVWLAVVIMMICNAQSVFASTVIDNLMPGCKIQVSVKSGWNPYHYSLVLDDNLACGRYQTGIIWTLVDAGDGCYYIKNSEKDLYWGQIHGWVGSSSFKDAAKVRLSWNSQEEGVCFRNETDGGSMLYWDENQWDNSEHYPSRWVCAWSKNEDKRYSDNYAIFEVKIVSTPLDGILINGIRYHLFPGSKTATVVANDYSGSVVIPEKVTYEGMSYNVTLLGNKCFYGCTKLKSVVLPKSITTIGESCFENCESLKSITLPEGLTFVGRNCFVGNNKLQITLPSTIKEIGEDAFVNQMILSFAVDPPKRASTDGSIAINCRVYVPRASVEKYKNSYAWKDAAIYPLYPVTNISVSGNQTLVSGSTTMLSYCIWPSNAGTKTVTWSSNKPKIASVDEKGCVTGHEIGDAVITATADDGSGVATSVTIHVTPLLVSEVKLDKESMNILPTTTGQITAMVMPELANNKTLKWTSDDESVATVTQEGIVKGIHAGTANITAVTTDGSNIAATCKVTVDALTINPKDTVLWINDTKQLEFSPSYAANNEMIWSSSNPAIAKVSENGLVTALAEGEADITVAVVVGDGIEAVSHVKVIIPANEINFDNPSVQIIGGESRMLNVNFNPVNASIKKLEWTSDNPSVVSVDDEGTIFGVKEGTSVITAKTTDGSNLAITCEVVVKGVKVVSLGQLTAGSVIKIYPRGDSSHNYYAQTNMAVACGGDGQSLTSYEEAGAGDLWTLIDAGDGYYYIKNDLGCYWPNQSCRLLDPLICTTSLEKAAKVILVWNSTFHGVEFWRVESPDGLYRYENGVYSWWTSWSESLSKQCVTTFNIALMEGGDKENLSKLITVDGIDYMLDLRHKTAAVQRNVYKGDVIIPEKISDEGIDYAVTSLSSLCFNACDELTSVTLPNSIVAIGDKCFSNSGLVSVILPNGITSLGDECFLSCTKLASIIIPKGVTTLGNYCFSNCSNLENITLPLGIASLGEGCFYGCKNLINIEIPDGLTSMGKFCFSDCSSLVNITLPEGITMLDYGCFRNSGLKNIILPSTLEVFDDFVFDGVDNDIIITCKATYPPHYIYPVNVDLVRSNDRLFVPRESLEKYKAHFSWKKAYSINPLYPVASISLPDEVSLEMGKTMTLDYAVLPENAGTKTVAWSSNNPDVASVDENGVVMGRMSGDAIIVATATDGTEVSTSCKVTVTPSTGIGNITMGDVKLVIKDRHLKVEGLADNDIVQIINTIGFTVYKGTEHEIDLKAAGVYIVKVKGKTLKFSVK